ncbi:hypothetical protein PHYBLDRAFT_164882 [Phycomyces blakesleeanus NRRL 1555(-)]|uniref:Retrotransposon gag domain-containing protein n=1 Tax=Phycomyces blakesleeanus (strain ATCC 8743b / DSM 1359 / FGSC 10004 / NBRC 33097 / NRRL 1555) TaxID=763407 RepID=A0A163ECT8_PHYB8|nr:hypothetical protein PHYBLDRAFT_164882 [Phycomyces blakesleeanus NRRL 1555(-)]OAD78000.1 hypothetical protein PHYBLDRAFT_164882 [Phycomyces blakesleeanus NRRL 1555(-)]|eukprot:XP_018296040.1 hypothetical protein PHYBLDRAFT_164882 [Phycomyces blakesleeanus NRRL 1555(-)]
MSATLFLNQRTKASINEMEEKLGHLYNTLSKTSAEATEESKDLLRKYISSTVEDLITMKTNLSLLQAQQINDTQKVSYISSSILDNLLMFQWIGREWNYNYEVFATSKECLDQFEEITRAHDIKFDSNWHYLLPNILSSEQHLWLKEYYPNPARLSWSTVKDDLITTFWENDFQLRVELTKELITMRMGDDESVLQYTERFQRVRRAAQIDDDLFTAVRFTNSLLPKLSEQVFYLQKNVPLKKRNSITHSAQIASSIYKTVMERKDFRIILSKGYNGSSTRSSHTSSCKSSRKYRSMEYDSYRFAKSRRCE